jgi:hypothetical protein
MQVPILEVVLVWLTFFPLSLFELAGLGALKAPIRVMLLVGFAPRCCFLHFA